jgi:hypothetical protein
MKRSTGVKHRDKEKRRPICDFDKEAVKEDTIWKTWAWNSAYDY